LANHKHALKKIKQDKKRYERNKSVRTRYRNLIKAVRVAVESGEPERAREALSKAAPYLQRVACKGLIHRNKAARHISRLTMQVEAMSAE